MTQIARKPSGRLAFQGFLPKNRVWSSVYKGLGDFRPKFSPKKIAAQVAFGFRSPEPDGQWLQNGVCLDGPSRLKGIETEVTLRYNVSLFCLDVPSRLKGIETFSFGSKIQY